MFGAVHGAPAANGARPFLSERGVEGAEGRLTLTSFAPSVVPAPALIRLRRKG